MKIIHIAPWMETDDPRILRARDTWNVLYRDFGWVREQAPSSFPRSKDDERRLILLGLLLDWAWVGSEEGEIIVFTCDDVVLRPCLDQQVRDLAQRCSLFTGHRVNCDTFEQAIQQQEIGEVSNGRVLIGYRREEWAKIAPYLPDIYCGTANGDLYIAALARKLAGKPWSQATDPIPEPACELTPGCIWHERHKPSWDGSMPADIHDRKLVAKAFREHLPEMIPDYLKAEL